MNAQFRNISSTINELYLDAKYDKLKMMKGAVKSIFKSFIPENFENAYLAISKEQGNHLVDLITQNNVKHVVEFGTSFGISTLFLAQGVLETNGHIITTELLNSKVKIAQENFKKAGVEHLIEVKAGNALETLKNHSETIDLLLLDGWMDLYEPLFNMLEPNFNNNTIVYVDNADMAVSQHFLTSLSTEKYHLESKFNGKAVIINMK